MEGASLGFAIASLLTGIRGLCYRTSSTPIIPSLHGVRKTLQNVGNRQALLPYKPILDLLGLEEDGQVQPYFLRECHEVHLRRQDAEQYAPVVHFPSP